MAVTTLQRSRSLLGTTALVLAAVSAIGLVSLVIGHILDPNHFSSDSKKEGTLDSVFFFMYFPCLVLAALTGVAAWIVGRRSRHAGDVQAGMIALGYVVIGIISFVLISNFG